MKFRPVPKELVVANGWDQWLAYNVSLCAVEFRKIDQGKWQEILHQEMRARGETPWTDRPIWTPRDSYGMKSA